MQDKTICIFTSFYPPHLGGVERYVYCLANELKSHINKVIVVTLNTESLSEIEQDDNLYIYRLPVYSLFQNRYPIPKKNKRFWLLIERILNHKPDLFIINLRFYILTLLAAKLGYKNNIPVISIEHITGHLTIHNPVLDFLGRCYENFITKETKKYVDSFYGVSKACNEWLKHFGIEAKGILYNSVNLIHNISDKTDLRQKNNIPDDAIVLISATRLLKEKGILLLVEAFKQINNKYPNTFLLIIGDGNLYDKLASEYRNGKQNILILGKKSNEEVLGFLSQSDVAVIPSYYPEGLPTLALEAGSLAKAVIATDVGGTKELIADKDYGLLIKPKSISELYNAMEIFILDEEYRASAGQNLRKRIEEHFTWQKRAEEIGEIVLKI